MDLYHWLTNQWDRTLGAIAALAGVIAVVLGWFGVSGAGLPSQQIPYLASGAVGGLFLLGVGATLWLSADARDEWRKLDELLDELRRARAEPLDVAEPPMNGDAQSRRRPAREHAIVAQAKPG